MRNAAEPCEKRIIFKKRKTKIGNETTCNERHIISNRLGSKSNSLAEIIRNALLWPTKSNAHNNSKRTASEYIPRIYDTPTRRCIINIIGSKAFAAWIQGSSGNRTLL